MGVKVSFEVGSRRHLGKTDTRYANEQLIEALGEEAMGRAMRNSHVNVQRLKQTLDRRIERSLKVAVQTAAKNLIGTLSAKATNPNATQKIFFDMGDSQQPAVNPSGPLIAEMTNPSFVEWRPLTTRTLKIKAGTASARGDRLPPDSARRYFVHHGDLRKEILGLAQTITKKTGTVNLYYRRQDSAAFSQYKGKASKLKIGSLRLKFLPGVPVSKLPGLQSGDPSDFTTDMSFEKSLGISEPSLKKLAGRGLSHRPLMQPIFTFWALNRIPRLVASTIQSNLVLPRRSGVEDFSSGGL